MTRKNYYASLIMLLIAISAITLYIRFSNPIQKYPIQQSAQPVTQLSGTATAIINSDETQLTDQVAMLEENIAKLTGQLESLNEKLNNEAANTEHQHHGDVLDYEDPGMAQSSSTAHPDDEIDPLSPQQIIQEDRRQNAFIFQLQDAFSTEPHDYAWSADTESSSMAILTDMDKFAKFSGIGKRDVDIPLSNLPDISVTQFNCRSNMCESEFLTGSMKELIAYQRYMIKNLAPQLPLAYFSPVEAVGNKFKMRVFLAQNEPRME